MNSTDMHKSIRSATAWVVVVTFVAAFSLESVAATGPSRFSGFKRHEVPFFKPERLKLLQAGLSQRVKGLTESAKGKIGEGINKVGEGFQHTFFRFIKPKKSIEPKPPGEPKRKQVVREDAPSEHVFGHSPKSKLSPIEAELIAVPGVLEQIKLGATGIAHTVQKKTGEIGHKILGTAPTSKALTSKAGSTTNNSLARAFSNGKKEVEGDKNSRKPVVEGLNDGEIPTISAVSANSNTKTAANAQTGDEYEPKIRETYRRVGLARAISDINWMLRNKMQIVGVDAATKGLRERIMARVTP